MKNKLLSKISNIDLWIILLFVILFRGFVYSFFQTYSTYPDTTTYINYDANIFKGEVDALRTPIYPSILKIIGVFSKDLNSIYTNIVFFQEIVSIVSIIVLYCTLKKTFKNRVANYVAVIIYACFPAIFTYNRIILTESLSISIFVIYFCLIIRYLAQPTTKKIIYIGIITIFLIFLRPSFLFLMVALAIIFVLIFFCKKENIKQAMVGGGVLVCIAIPILGYSYLNKINNGIFGLSNVTQINQLDIVIQMEIYDTGDSRDEGIIKIINQRLDGYNAQWHGETKSKVMEIYSTDEIGSYLKRCVKNNFPQYVVGIIEKTLKVATKCMDNIYLWTKNNTLVRPIIPFALLYVYIVYDVIYIIIKIVKNKKIPLEQFTILIIILGQFATLLIGAQAEFSRLFLPALPIVIVSLAWHLDEVLNWYNIETQEKLEEGKDKENEISN